DESMLYHFPNNTLFKRISEAVEIPIIEKYCNDIRKEQEIGELCLSVKQAIDQYSIKGLIHATISSRFQLKVFEEISNNLNLKLYSPVWGIDPFQYYNDLMDSDFEIIITRVAAHGLDEKWLGRTIDRENYELLKKYSKKYKFNITFEGGEAETMVLNCPIYKKRIRIAKYSLKWDGIRGTFEILDVDLITK
ncbi:MAG TPA: diphthine--ammonia ligase, partial [Phototrophicaceae bacterium]|nr:diphthine--ammonia ligase [Phototrophicaceae bacterium]